jgi:protein gp37
MTGKTSIEWTDKSWNPVVGCSIVSPGCANCYAMKQAGRMLDGNPKTPHYAGTTQPSKAGAVWTGKLALAPEKTLLAPLRWSKPAMIFVNSMGDLFHESVPDEWIMQAFAVMQIAHRHTFQVLTKRADRMRAWMSAPNREEELNAAIHALGLKLELGGAVFAEIALGKPVRFPWPAPHIWLGVSAEDQKRADERIPHLLETPAAVRFVSAEPLLGAIELYKDGLWFGPQIDDQMESNRVKLDWIIVGGESGRDARPMHPDWARSIRDQCAAAGVPYFFKQWGEWISAAAPGHSDETGVLMPDGEFLRGRRVLDWSSEEGWIVKRLGKARAGRLLDGATHDGMPEIPNA